MKQKKFEIKCQELVVYEDNCFEEIKAFIRPFNLKLNKLGYEIIARCFWHCFHNDGSDDFGLERLLIEKQTAYSCSLSIQFQLKEMDPDDEENGIGFQIIHTITSYGRSLFRRYSFSKRKLHILYKFIEKGFAEIIQNGLEATAKKYNT